MVIRRGHGTHTSYEWVFWSISGPLPRSAASAWAVGSGEGGPQLLAPLALSRVSRKNGGPRAGRGACDPVPSTAHRKSVGALPLETEVLWRFSFSEARRSDRVKCGLRTGPSTAPDDGCKAVQRPTRVGVGWFLVLSAFCPVGVQGGFPPRGAWARSPLPCWRYWTAVAVVFVAGLSGKVPGLAGDASWWGRAVLSQSVTQFAQPLKLR